MKLCCPICAEALVKKDRSAVCAKRHTYDYAASGYLNLLRKEGAAHGDDAEMIKARTSFLETGAYSFLRDSLQEISEDAAPDTLIDLGCGEGYYTAALAGHEKYGFDLSKSALKHAAKNDPSTQYVLSSIFHLPLPDDSCDMAVTCFAPVAEDEILRLLKKNGCFLLVTPGEDHLFELKEQLYESPYKNPQKEPVTKMTCIKDEVISRRSICDHDSLRDLFRMTPYAWKTGIRGMEILESLDRLEITAQFRIRLYQKP